LFLRKPEILAWRASKRNPAIRRAFRSKPLTNIIRGLLKKRRIRNEMGIRALPLSYSGVFAHGQIGYRVTCRPSAEILTALEANDQEIGVLTLKLF